MNKNKLFTYLILISFTIFSTAAKALALFNILLTTSPPQQFVTRDFSGIITYSVTNQTRKTRSITMIPISGVMQTSTQAGDCTTVTTLQPNASCVLRLEATRDSMIQAGLNQITVIPTVCKTIGSNNNNPDLHFCSKSCQASEFIRLEIEKKFPTPRAKTYVALNTKQKLAYITSQDLNMVFRCTIESDQTLGLCEDAGLGNIFENPGAIFLNDTGDTAYVVVHQGKTVYKCSINSHGTFETCHDTNGTIDIPNKGPLTIPLPEACQTKPIEEGSRYITFTKNKKV